MSLVLESERNLRCNEAKQANSQIPILAEYTYNNWNQVFNEILNDDNSILDLL